MDDGSRLAVAEQLRLGEELRQRVNRMKPSGRGSGSEGSTSASDDDGDDSGSGGEGFAGPGAGRGMSGRVKAAALEMLEGARAAGAGAGGARGKGRARVAAVLHDDVQSLLAEHSCRVLYPALPHAGNAEGEAPAKGLFSLPFMQRAMERRKQEAQQQAQEVRGGLCACVLAGCFPTV
jgi:U3 small nucleolar RNA-associated protein 14